MSEADPRRIGIYGGTFDPVHLCHLALARLARDRFALAEVLIVPAPEPPHKHKAPVAPFAERCAMLDLALATEPDCARLTCSRVEEDLPRPSYTIQTVRTIMERESGSPRRFALIIGMDSLEMLPEWRDAEDLLRLVDLIVVNRDRLSADDARAHIRRLRPEYALEALTPLPPSPRGRGGKVTPLPLGEGQGVRAPAAWRNTAGRTLELADDFDFPLSSTAIRQALARGESPPGLPQAVLAHIRTRGLYT